MRFTSAFALLVILLIPAAMLGCAALGVQPQSQARVEAKMGESIRLTNLGSKEAEEDFCLKETVPVYRYYGRTLQKEVGQVRITRYVGEHSFDAVVVKGEVKDGDVARKESPACLIQLPESGGK